ncbi:PTS sugar transporter subunit IIA [Lactobacillus sp. PSON]|uniref:PTS sugar transporter subunit IIA n=1 Tax=Lactobacillus sp. PSON TaxID=3455454 RepID=UPI0040418162
MLKQNYFNPNAVYVIDGTSQDEVLKKIYDKLLENGYVKGNFLEHIINREHNFPTGLTLNTLGKNLPNIAIPHTEGEFVNTSLIIPVALKTPVVFHNMIKPREKLEAKFLFMLLDNHPDGQAQLLSKVMDFLGETPTDELRHFLNFENPKAIYEFLEQKF